MPEGESNGGKEKRETELWQLDFGLAIAKSPAHKPGETCEDAGFAGQSLVMACDGVGGDPGGEVASALTVEKVVQSLGVTADSAPLTLSTAEAEGRLRAAVDFAATALGEREKAEPALTGMHTTLSLLWLFKNRETGNLAYALAQLGDSRIYRLRGAELTQLSPEHLWIQEFQRQYKLTFDAGDLAATISAEEIRQRAAALRAAALQAANKGNFAGQRCFADEANYLLFALDSYFKGQDTRVGDWNHIISRVVGAGEGEPEIMFGEVQPGDCLVACSDGLTKNLTDEALRQALHGSLRQGESAQAISANLVTRVMDAMQWSSENSDDVVVCTLRVAKVG